MDGKLTVFDPLTKQIFPKETFQGGETYYANTQGAEKDSWLAGHIEEVKKFSNMLKDDSAVVLYRINFDDSFH
jgi:hypothetical protein